MKNRIIEICELGQPQSIIHRENQPITELIKTDSLIEELNQQLNLSGASQQRKLLIAFHKWQQKMWTNPNSEITENVVDVYLKRNL